jgi:hypothetical protein
MKAFLISKRFFIYLFIFVFILISVIVSIYLATDRRAAEELIKVSLNRQERLTEQTAATIGSFFSLSSRSIVLLGQNLSLIDDSNLRKKILDDFVTNLNVTPLVGVAVTDSNGIVVEHSTRTGITMLGVDLSDRGYFSLMKQAKPLDVYISKPEISKLGASKGKVISVLTTPVIAGGEFRGVISAAIVLEDLFDYYLRNAVPSNYEVYLLDTDGTIHIFPDLSHVGHNIFDPKELTDTSHDLFRDEYKKIVGTNQSGGVDTVLIKDFDGETAQRSLLTYAPIRLDDGKQTWFLILVSPVKDVLAFTAPIYIQQITLIVGVFFLLLMMAIFALGYVRVRVPKNQRR